MEAATRRGLAQGGVGAREDRRLHRDRRSQVDRVVALPPVELGQLGRVQDEVFGDLDERELLHECVELLSSPPVLTSGESAAPAGGGQCCPTFDDDERGGDELVSGVPDRSCSVRACFFDQQPEQGRRVDVGDHRRWSAARSLTGPFALMRVAGRCRVLDLGGRTAPDATRSASRSSA